MVCEQKNATGFGHVRPGSCDLFFIKTVPSWTTFSIVFHMAPRPFEGQRPGYIPAQAEKSTVFRRISYQNKNVLYKIILCALRTDLVLLQQPFSDNEITTWWNPHNILSWKKKNISKIIFTFSLAKVNNIVVLLFSTWEQSSRKLKWEQICHLVVGAI